MSKAHLIAIVALMVVAINSNPVTKKDNLSEYMDKCLDQQNIEEIGSSEAIDRIIYFLRILKCELHCSASYHNLLDSKGYLDVELAAIYTNATQTDPQEIKDCKEKYYDTRSNKCDYAWNVSQCAKIFE